VLYVVYVFVSLFFPFLAVAVSCGYISQFTFDALYVFGSLSFPPVPCVHISQFTFDSPAAGVADNNTKNYNTYIHNNLSLHSLSIVQVRASLTALQAECDACVRSDVLDDKMCATSSWQRLQTQCAAVAAKQVGSIAC
jgi:hypothetical protein